MIPQSIRSKLAVAWTLLLAVAVASGPSRAQSTADVVTGGKVQPVGLLGRTGGSGPMPATAESVAGMPMNTVYRPQPLPQRRLPLLLWGNGGCRDNGLGYAQFLREVASHGYFIVSAGYPREERALRPPQSPAAAPPPAAVAPEPGKTDVQQLLAAIDWATREDRDPKSPFHQRIDTRRIGVMGTSCGGLQAIAVATDPRVKTSIAFNSGVLIKFPPGVEASNANLVVRKAALKDLRGPIAYVNGGPTDIAYENGLDDFQRIAHQPVLFAENGVGHGGTYLFDERGGEYSQVAIAWMRWQLEGDESASKWFRGADCVLCKRTGWKVRKKNFYGESVP